MQNQELLSAAATHWQNLADFRARRRRCKNYTYGRQWTDRITVDGRSMPEEDYIRSQGNVPLKNNLIRRMVRSILGIYRNTYRFPSPEALSLNPDIPSDANLYENLLKNAFHNRLEEIHARTMEEFLISGMAIHRKGGGARLANAPADAPADFLRTDYVSPDSFFVDSNSRDFRGWDATIVGQIHDIPFTSLCASFASSPADCRNLGGIYSPTREYDNYWTDFGGEPQSRDFLTPSAPGLCRVIEVWQRKAIPRYRVHDLRQGKIFKINESEYDNLPENNPLIRTAWFVDEEWEYWFLAPSGHVLAHGPSPLPGGGQPYVWKAYPFIDGEIHSFVSDVIDQQRHTNRLITLYDWVMRSTAKGVLLFPESALPEGMDINDVADEWSKFNGLILFRPKAGMPLPQQVCGNASQVGIAELLQIQLKMMEDVSGVSGALEGKTPSSSTSGSLYTQQTRQALTALLDILESYGAFQRESARLDKLLLKEGRRPST